MKKVLVALSVCAAFSFAGCIDREFELTDVSGEMTVGGEELTVPLADINNVYLSDLLKGNDVITNDSEGVYQIYFSSFGDNPNKYESISIDGIKIPAIENLSPKLDPVSFDMAQLPESINLDDITENFYIDFPTIGEIVRVQPIQIQQRLELNLPQEVKELIALGNYELPDYIANLCDPLTSSYEGTSTFNAELSILQQLEKIDYVEFGDANTPEGAPFSINITLNGIARINGGGTVNLNLVFPEGYDLVLPKEYEGRNDIKLNGHNILTLDNYKIEKQQESVELLLYLHRIDYSHHTFEDGRLNVNDTISFDYNLSLSLCGGKFDLSDLPELKIEATPVYKDGFNFDAKNRRPSYTHEDMFLGFILGMDTFALGLIKAAELIEDGRLDQFKKERYSSYYNTEIGKKIINNETSLEELSAYAEKLGNAALPGSGKQEYLESVINQVLFQ